MCVSLIQTSLQYGDEWPDGNYSANANYSAFVKPYPNNCTCHDPDGRIYNLSPLQNTDGTARFAKHYCKNSGRKHLVCLPACARVLYTAPPILLFLSFFISSDVQR